jgi:hypothetical protein
MDEWIDGMLIQRLDPIARLAHVLRATVVTYSFST